MDPAREYCHPVLGPGFYVQGDVAVRVLYTIYISDQQTETGHQNELAMPRGIS